MQLMSFLVVQYVDSHRSTTPSLFKYIQVLLYTGDGHINRNTLKNEQNIIQYSICLPLEAITASYNL